MTIAEICQLSDEVRTGELLISVFIDRAIKAPSSKEADRNFVLRATYPTAPLRSLTEHMAQKLSGQHPKGSAVIRGTYGSGKSHGLLALYHVVAAGEEARPVLETWGVQVMPPAAARVAVVQLRAENPLTLWEFLFERAQRADLNGQVRDYPTREDWATLGREKPTLLIVDELEDWFAAQDEEEQARTKAALANLLEAAELSDASLAVALAVYGTNDELMAIINRLQPPVWDVGTAEDRQKIVRHRLIDRVKDEAKAREVVRSYIETYENVRSELPGLVNLGDLRREMEAAYPFHPLFLRQAYQVYAAMPRHESTRGVVGVCATLLRRLAWQRDLILTGDLDVTDEEIASDLRKLDPELVANTVEDLRERCAAVGGASGILGTILLHSFSPTGIPGAMEEQVLLGSLRPKVNINDLRRALEEVRQQTWFVDEVNDRLLISKEVVLVKQIEQMARARLETVDGQAQAAEYLRNLIRQAVGGEHLTLHPEEPLPTALAGTALKTVVSLEAMNESEALELLRGLDNTVILIAPKLAVRERLTKDREFLLRALRVLVCEVLLRQQTKRQTEVRRLLRQQYEPKLGQHLRGAYGRWMRLSRLNELGEEPNFIVRPEPCTPSAEGIRQTIQKVYDVDSVREGLARLLRHQGRGSAKGSEQAGLTVRQLHEGLRRHPGLPMMVDGQRLEQALKAMVADGSPDGGVVVQVGKALYGYEGTVLPSIISPDWRVWLKKYGPEPPAKADVKQRARQELARTRADEIEVRGLKRAVTAATGTATAEVARALAELVNEGEAVLEQESGRYPDDGPIASEMVQDSGRAWLAEYAPPDARKAERRILDIITQAGDSGISFGQVKTQLGLEGIGELAMQRAMNRLRNANQVGVYTSDGQALLGEAIPDECLLRLPRVYRPPKWATEPPGKPLAIPVGPYRFLDQLLSDLRSRLQETAQIREATFSVKPFESSPDPVFRRDEEVQRIAQESIEHRLTWKFVTPISKGALLTLVQRLRERLGKEGEVTVEMMVAGEVPDHGAG
ncbi:MAG: DUF499 domain-containing protein [Ardenticatenia bacterium]|nr:DUF499 domain-containing protein [Ardenticatenia bacterium]